MTTTAFAHRTSIEPMTFVPGTSADDASARYWLTQVTLRLRREVCWLWRERTLQSAQEAESRALPPNVDATLAALDLTRYERDKRAFFSEDATASHLSARIAASAPADVGDAAQGSFGWLVQRLRLAPVERFMLALALLPAVDSAAGQVIAACLNDPSRTTPTLALAQRLWDEPDALMRCFDPAHALWIHGVIAGVPGPGLTDWHASLAVPPLVARTLVATDLALPDALEPFGPGHLPVDLAGASIARMVAVLRAPPTDGMRLLPLLGSRDAPFAAVAGACAERAGMYVLKPKRGVARGQLAQLLTVAWLHGAAVYLPAAALADGPAHEAALSPPPLPGLPLTVFVGISDRAAMRALGPTSPPVIIPALTYAERLACWRRLLPDPEVAACLPELARRFRYGESTIERVAGELAALGRTPSEDEIHAAARADIDLGTLAQAVAPRFARAELMLPRKQSAQIDELIAGMRNLTRVHHEWGTARAWNESGLAALFAGPSGTGKTMAAEAIAAELALPLYRIDLSQVVNKYIGETEKNLRQLFDAVDSADAILFFDEADALFGKRTEVKDAHDRYANLEISYLLERMERFKGLAILATNRRKDLDEAFLRRLRFVVEFPLPEVAERLRIWKSVVPADVDASALDYEFLAQRFPLAGGHIRAVVFQACLQTANDGAPRSLSMPAVVRAVQREYDKLERASSLDQFGPYASLVAGERSTR